MSDIRAVLENMNKDIYGSNNSLMGLVKVIGLRPRPKTKADAVDALCQFYSNQSNASELYNRLNKFEKALLTCVVQSKNRPLWEDLCAIAKAHIGRKEWLAC